MVRRHGRCTPQLEHLHGTHQFGRLGAQAAGRRGHLFHQCGILLRGLVHVGDGFGDLVHALALLGAGGADLAHEVGGTADRGDDFRHGGPCPVHELAAAAHALDAAGDELLDFLGRRGAALREGAHLGRHHGESAALLAGARGLHGRVQREDVGLEGDAVDHADDVADLPAAVLDFLHGVHHLRDDGAAIGRHAGGGLGQFVGTARAVGVAAHGRAELFHGCGGLLQSGGLPLGAGGQVVVARSDLAAGGGHALRTGPHGGHHGREPVAHRAQAGHHAGAVPHTHRHIHGQVASRHGQGHPLEVGRIRTQLANHGSQVPAQPGETGHHDQHRDRGEVAVGLGQFLHVVDALGQAFALALLLLPERCQQAVARGDRAVHEHGERLILAAGLDELDVVGAGGPELVHEGRDRGIGLAAVVGDHVVPEILQRLLQQGALCRDVGQGGVELLGRAREDGVPQLQRDPRDVQLQLGDALQLRNVVGADHLGIVAEPLHHGPDRDGRDRQQHEDERVDRHQTPRHRPAACCFPFHGCSSLHGERPCSALGALSRPGHCRCGWCLAIVCKNPRKNQGACATRRQARDENRCRPCLAPIPRDSAAQPSGPAGQAVGSLQQRLARLLDNTHLPRRRVGVERGQHLLPDRLRLAGGRLGMQVQPVVGAQGLQHLQDGHGAVFERDAGHFGLRALFVHAVPHEPGEEGGARRAVVDRRHRRRAAPAPPGPCTRDGGGIVAAGVDALAMAARPEAGVQVDPADVPRGRAVRAQHAPQGEVAPGGPGAAEEQALRELVLPRGDGGLPGRFAALGDERGHGALVLRRRRPPGRQQQRRDIAVGLVDRQGAAEILEIAVQVHVLVRGAARVREAVRIQPVDVEHRQPRIPGPRAPRRVVQREHLHPAAAMALHAVAGAAQDEQAVRIGRPVAHHVHRQRLAFAARQWMRMRLHREAGRSRRIEEPCAGLRIGGRKRVRGGDHPGRFLGKYVGRKRRQERKAQALPAVAAGKERQGMHHGMQAVARPAPGVRQRAAATTATAGPVPPSKWRPAGAGRR